MAKAREMSCGPLCWSEGVTHLKLCIEESSGVGERKTAEETSFRGGETLSEKYVS